MKKKLVIVIGLLINYQLVNAASVIPLQECTKITQERLKNSRLKLESGPFYCVNLAGSVFANPMLLRFDSGARTLIVNQSCLRPGSYRIIAQNVPDEWGNNSMIVQGEVSLIDKSGNAYTIPDFQFFANVNNPGASCDSSFSNFGAGMNLDHYIYPHSKNTAETKKSKKTNDNPYCLGSFFSFFPYSSTAYNAGYIFNPPDATSAVPYLTVGTLNAEGFTAYGLQKQVMDCGGKTNVASYVGSTNWEGATLPNFLMQIGPIVTPVLTAMVDSGGGMAIISDDASGTLVKRLGTLASPCPSNIPWLNGCQCLNSGLGIYVLWQNMSINYHYTSTATQSDQSAALAVCPPWTSTSPNPYIVPNGVNLGYQLFNHNAVMFDFKNGAIGLKPLTDKKKK